MAKMRVAVLFGGVSGEHEISRISAAAIVDNMDGDKYEIYKVGITKKGRWLLFPGDTAAMRDGSWEKCPDCVPAFVAPDTTTHGLVQNHDASFDVAKLDLVFPALHGNGGEDGTIQGLLELAGIPYVGCGPLASAVCMDKYMANMVFAQCGLPHTPWLMVRREELTDIDRVHQKIAGHLTWPIFVKPASAGSSLGVTKVHAPDGLQDALLLAGAHDKKIIVEQAVVGREVECAVMGNETVVATLPGEIVSCNEVYDYEAKYQSGDASKLYLPARMEQSKLEEVRDMAEKAYRAVGCEGLSRIDFFVEEGTGQVLLSEINTMPGFTPISMFPKLMEHDGIPFPELVDRLIEYALERAES